MALLEKHQDTGVVKQQGSQRQDVSDRQQQDTVSHRELPRNAVTATRVVSDVVGPVDVLRVFVQSRYAKQEGHDPHDGQGYQGRSQGHFSRRLDDDGPGPFKRDGHHGVD